jgi:hypothetical protein
MVICKSIFILTAVRSIMCLLLESIVAREGHLATTCPGTSCAKYEKRVLGLVFGVWNTTLVDTFSSWRLR